MFKKTTIVAAVVTGFMVSTAVNAKEVTLETFLSAMVSQAAHATKNELQLNVQKAVLTVNNMIGADDVQEYATQVTITDLPENEAEDDKAE